MTKLVNCRYEELFAIDVKSKIISKLNSFKQTYKMISPRYLIISEEQASLLQADMCIYLNKGDFGVLEPTAYGMKICISNRIKTLDDIEIY